MDSTIDHVWTNSADRVIRHGNDVRAASDHHVISVEIAMKDIKTGGTNIVKRMWKNFNKDDFLTDLKKVDWDPVMQLSNVDTANSLLEELFCHTLDKHAPIGTCQIRTRYNNWISQETKDQMYTRDQAWIKSQGLVD